MNEINITLANEVQTPPFSATVLTPSTDQVNSSLAETSLVLNDTFIYYKSKVNVRVELHKDSVKFFNLKNTNAPNEATLAQKPSLTLRLADICGSRVAMGHQKNDQKSYLTVYAYVTSTNWLNEAASNNENNTNHIKPNVSNKIKPRKRVTLDLACAKYATYDENLAHVNHWHAQLSLLTKTCLYDAMIMLQQQSNTNNTLAGANSNLLYEYFYKPFLVLVNPKSGSGKAKSIYFERVVPVWSESNQQNKLVFTRNKPFYFSVKQIRLKYVKKIFIERKKILEVDF